MAEMNEFEDLEAHLRRQQPAAPRPELRNMVLQAARSQRRYRLLWGLAKAAAVLLVLGFSFAVERANQAMERRLLGSGRAPLLLVVKRVVAPPAEPGGEPAGPARFVLVQVLPTSPEAALLAKQRSVFDAVSMKELFNGT
jgi:hypothetical protein